MSFVAENTVKNAKIMLNIQSARSLFSLAACMRYASSLFIFFSIPSYSDFITDLLDELNLYYIYA